MKRFLLVLLCMMTFLAPLKAKVDADLFGYYEFQATGAFIDNEFVQLFSNKLRLDIKSSLSEKITFAANFNIITFHGKTKWDILDLLPYDISSQAAPGTELFYILPFENRYYLDNAYLKIAFEHFDLTLGKQQISPGTGYVWNPTDIFNIKDYLDPSYEQPGHNAVRLDIPLGNTFTLTGLYAPEDNFKNSAKLIMLKGRIWRFDLTFTAAEKNWLFHDYTKFDLTLFNFTELPSKRQLLGFSTAGELFHVGVWAEFAYNWMGQSENFYELVIGADYTFDFQTYIMIEFYRNTLAKDDPLLYDLNDWMRMFAQEQKSVSRDQFYLFIQHPFGDFLHLGISGIYSSSDNSLALIPTLNYTMSDNVEITAYLNLLTGKEGTGYSSRLGSGGMFRIRVYF